MGERRSAVVMVALLTLSASLILVVGGQNSGEERIRAGQVTATTVPLAALAQERLAFGGSESTEHAVYVFGLFTVNADGGDLRRLSTTTDRPDWPEWSPNGTSIAYAEVEGGTTPTMRIVRADGSVDRPLVEGADYTSARASWSPDSRHVVLAVTRLGRRALEVVDVLTGEARVVADEPVTGSASWSPDGKLIAYPCESSLCVVRPDGTDRREIARPTHGDAPSWSPDSRRLAFVGDVAFELGRSPAEIFTVGADATGLERLTDNGDMESSVRWSPDGHSILYMGDGVRVMQADGTGDRLVTPPGTPCQNPSWSRSSAWIALECRGDPVSIGIVRPDGSDFHQLELPSIAAVLNPAWQ